MIVRLVRSLRTLLPFGIPVWLLFRLVQPRGLENGSFLQLLLEALSRTRDWWISLALESSFSGCVPLMSRIGLLSEDVLGFLLASALWRLCYCWYHVSWKEWKEGATDRGFELALQFLPGFQAKFDQQKAKFCNGPDLEAMLGKSPDRVIATQLPEVARPAEQLLEELRQTSTKEDLHWKDGKLSGTVYPADPEHGKLMAKTFELYTWSNPMHLGTWPKLTQCSAEVVAMTGNLMNAPEPYGCVTSGGTESILLAIKSHLFHYGKRRGIAYPELICGTTAHAAVDKACELFHIRQIRVDCSQGPHYTLSPTKVRSLVTSNTIMIFASSPCYPQGVVDPTEELSKIALDYDIGLHSDACLGGFVLPFASDAPVFDFRCPGVTSMSVDTHKFGYAAKGTSVVLYRTKQLRQAQYFCYSKWTGGMYATPTLAGSRPGALETCAWTALMSIGRKGYQERAQSIIQTARDMARGIDEIPGLVLMSKLPFMVVSWYAEDPLDIYAIGKNMSHRGWTLNELQSPASLHFCVTLNLVGKANAFVKDLKDAVEEERLVAKRGGKRTSPGIYGAAGQIPEGPINLMLQEVLDISLAP